MSARHAVKKRASEWSQGGLEIFRYSGQSEVVGPGRAERVDGLRTGGRSCSETNILTEAGA